MVTKFDIGDKVVIKACVTAIKVNDSNNSPYYTLVALDGNGEMTNYLHVNEKMLLKMQEEKDGHSKD